VTKLSLAPQGLLQFRSFVFQMGTLSGTIFAFLAMASLLIVSFRMQRSQESDASMNQPIRTLPTFFRPAVAGCIPVPLDFHCRISPHLHSHE
jgi:hypothetical protein